MDTAGEGGLTSGVGKGVVIKGWEERGARKLDPSPLDEDLLEVWL